eukprot:GHVS01086266.1.p1 GENE.GHVS01086266.1~~GHVS01086266.1.p1  ORF type:complete len:241 (+),score=20.72 GHVS01086266.1:1184-1906(+)
MFRLETLLTSLKELKEEFDSIQFDVVPHLLLKHKRDQAHKLISALKCNANAGVSCIANCACINCTTTEVMLKDDITDGVYGLIVDGRGAARVRDIGTYHTVSTTLFTCARCSDFQKNLPAEFFQSQDEQHRGNNRIRDSVVGSNVKLADSSVVIKHSIIGAGVQLGKNVRITKSVLMADCAVMDGSVINNCIIGREAKICENSKLTGCHISSFFVVEKDGAYDMECLNYEAEKGTDGNVE